MVVPKFLKKRTSLSKTFKVSGPLVDMMSPLDTLEKGRTVASKSNCHVQMSCTIVKDGALLKVGYNKRLDNHDRSVHAEADAIQKVLDHYGPNEGPKRLKGSTMYVMRFGARDEPRLATPCHACRKLVYEHGIKIVFYTLSVTGDWWDNPIFGRWRVGREVEPPYGVSEFYEDYSHIDGATPQGISPPNN